MLRFVKTGDRLRILRSALDLKQHEVAQRAGIQRVTYTRLEGNQRSPQKETVDLLAEALAVPRQALVSDLACMREVSRILGVKASDDDLLSEGPLVDQARRLASQLTPEAQAAAAGTLSGLVSMMQLQKAAPPAVQPVPSRVKPLTDEGRRARSPHGDGEKGSA